MKLSIPLQINPKIKNLISMKLKSSFHIIIYFTLQRFNMFRKPNFIVECKKFNILKLVYLKYNLKLWSQITTIVLDQIKLFHFFFQLNNQHRIKIQHHAMSVVRLKREPNNVTQINMSLRLLNPNLTKLSYFILYLPIRYKDSICSENPTSLLKTKRVLCDTLFVFNNEIDFF